MLFYGGLALILASLLVGLWQLKRYFLERMQQYGSQADVALFEGEIQKVVEGKSERDVNVLIAQKSLAQAEVYGTPAWHPSRALMALAALIAGILMLILS